MPLNAIREVAAAVLGIYASRKVPRASAAMSYHLTMTVFPMIICLYAMFGQNYDAAMRVFNYIEQFLTPAAADLIRSFLIHVAGSGGSAVLVAAVTILFTSASAAVRVLEGTIGEMQGGDRFKALADFVISLVLAVALVLAVYLAFIVMVFSRGLLDWIEAAFKVTLAGSSWLGLRFLLLGGVALLLLWGAFGFARRREDRYRVLPGAAFATAGIVVMSSAFSNLIASSARYSLVYGSLASLILLMLWLYLISQTIFIGAALNIALRDLNRK